MRKSTLLWILLFLMGGMATCVIGAIPWQLVWEGAVDRILRHTSQWNPLLDERLPRLIVLLCTGASLSVSGAVMQSLFQNPLASPSILGITSGGCLFVIPIFIFAWHAQWPFLIPLGAFLGCLLTLLLVYGLAKRQGQVHMTQLILTGIAVSTFFLAIQGAVLYALRDHWQFIQLFTEWESGSTADMNWKHVHMQLPLTLVGLWGCWTYRQEINILSLGEEEAANLGVDVAKVRWRLFLCVALLTGGALASIGVILFFGLILPHIVRVLYPHQLNRLILNCIVGGALALLYMDLLLKIGDIHYLSIGNISAILGGGFFLLLLLGRKRGLVTHA
jgi:iron complex transport system permease protein